MRSQSDSALQQAIDQADRLIEHGDLQQAKALLLEAKASLSDTPRLSDTLAGIDPRLERISLLDAIRQAIGEQRWSEALEQIDRLAPGDAAVEPLRREARQGMVQLLRRQATAAEAKADWLGAITLLRQAQGYDSSNKMLAAAIAEDQHALDWGTALRESFSRWQAAQEQQPVTPNSAPSLDSDELAEAEDSQAEEEPGPTLTWRRLLVTALVVGAALIVVGSAVALATSGGTVLSSLLHPPTPTETAQPTLALTPAAATIGAPVPVAATPTDQSASPAMAPETATAIASATPMPALTPTATPATTPAQTPTLSPTQTPSPTTTMQSTRTPTPTSTVQSTDTPTPTGTVQPTNTPTTTSTVQPTNTPVPPSAPKPTNTALPSSTPKPTDTRVPSPVPTRQSTPPTPTPAF